MLLVVSSAAFAQQEGHVQHTEVSAATVDSGSVFHAFKKGKLDGHFRYFGMATINEGNLSDYYANAIGGGIKYETAAYKGFRMGISGFFIFNIGSSNLEEKDEITGQPNRYEIGLFDITDPNNKHDIDRLEELYITYSWKSSKLSVGAQLINTPFINEQDGRMRPTEVAGIYTYFRELKNTSVEGGYIASVSPRSTVNWYSVARSIGVYSQGINREGQKNDYAGNTSSAGILLLDVKHSPVKGLQLNLSELFVENVFNTTLLQVDYESKLGKHTKWFAGLQTVSQFAIADGGNADAMKAYYPRQNKAFTFGMRAGASGKQWESSINVNRITAQGQYLMPREWGRDPFYTFLPRERSEGFGDVTALVAQTTYRLPKARLKAGLAIGTVKMPSVYNYSLNKYGMPSYHHMNVDVRHQFGGFWHGFDLHFLYTHKWLRGDDVADRYKINKVNMGNWNLILNFKF